MSFDLEFESFSPPPDDTKREIICEYQTPDGKYCSLESTVRLRVLCPIRSLKDAISTLRCPEYEPTTTAREF